MFLANLPTSLLCFELLPLFFFFFLSPTLVALGVAELNEAVAVVLMMVAVELPIVL